jgi:drug/metabolite transporter (DMT)-like permease
LSHDSGNELKAIALAIAAVSFFAAMDSTVGWLSTHAALPILMMLWFRYVVQAVASTAMFWPQRRMSLFVTRHPWLQLLRGLLLLACSGFAFLSLKHLPVGEFTAIIMMTPIIITLVASYQFKEHVSALRWVLVFGGFAGVLTIIRPGHESFSWAWLLPFIVMLSNTGFQLLTSRMTKDEDPATMHVYTGWVGTLCCTLVLPWAWTPIARWQDWLWMAAVGGLGTYGHFLLIHAYARAPASTLTPYMYSQIGVAMLAGWLLFAHVPDAYSLTGMALIALCGAAGAWLAVRERQAQQDQKQHDQQVNQLLDANSDALT